MTQPPKQPLTGKLATDTSWPGSIERWIMTTAAAIIALMPFHAFLTVWLASGIGHYTAVRLWKEYLLVALLAAAVAALSIRPALRGRIWREPVLALIGVYVLLLLVSGVVALAGGAVSPKAMAYGFLLDSRFLLFFVVIWLVGQHDDLIVRYWRQILLIPAALVVSFAVLQYFVLPPDFLKHFGYGADTIAPVATVDEKLAYQRVQSTLRGANPLGAYLVIIMTAAGALLIRSRRFRPGYAALLALSATALAVTYSRSAWIGVVVALGWLVWTVALSRTMRRMMIVAGSVAVLVFAAVGYSLRDNDRFQNAFFHTDENSVSTQSSNSGRLAALEGGVHDIVHQPLGLGTGTAGPASVYNTHPTRLAENYYLQLGQEIGLTGMGLFIAINIQVGRLLWRRRTETLPRILLASLIGLTVDNMLSHAWTDDTLAYVWWGLAGAALAWTSKTGVAGVAGVPETVMETVHERSRDFASTRLR